MARPDGRLYQQALKTHASHAMGHMNQRRQNIRSNPKAPIADSQTLEPYLVSKTHLVYAVVVDEGQL
jgi:hypothetical protein